MSDENTRAPLHLWIVGVVSLLWNLFGANDYFQTQSGNLDYIRDAVEPMGIAAEDAIAYFQSFPVWADIFWAFGVWGALGGSILLLMRSKFAVWAFALSLLGLAVMTGYQLIVPQPEWTKGGFMTVINIIIWSIATFLLIYARSMEKKGVLR